MATNHKLEELTIKTIQLELEQVCVNAVIHGKVLNPQNLEIHVKNALDAYGHQIVAHLVAFLYTDTIKEIKWPETWWDHFKLRWFGPYIYETLGWAGFGPIKYKRYKVKVMYPDIPFDGSSRHKVYIQEDIRWP